MNTNQINSFLCVAKHLSFSKAAEELFIAQSSVSRNVALLEEEWGVRLFVRSGKTISLTDAGRDYARLCRRMRKDFDNLREKYRPTQASLKIQYAAFPAWNISKLLYENAEHVRARHPDWEISLKFCQAGQLVQELLGGSVDLIFYFGDLLGGVDGIEMRTLLELPQIVVYSAQHPLGKKRSVSITDFRAEPFLYVPDETLTPEVIRCQVRAVEKRCGFRMNTRLLDSVDELSIALESGQGVALMDYWSRYRSNPMLRYIGIDLPLPIVLAWRKEAENPAIREFVANTVDFFARQ